MRVNSERELLKLAKVNTCEEVPINTLVRVGSPAREIVEVATDLNADIIVISTHGRTGFKHVLIGSVAENVVQRAPCPVLIVREREHEFLAQQRIDAAA